MKNIFWNSVNFPYWNYIGNEWTIFGNSDARMVSLLYGMIVFEKTNISYAIMCFAAQKTKWLVLL